MTKAPKAIILIVDDNAANILSLEAVLEADDRTLLTASNGKDALQITLKRHVDLIILDVQMPEMDGFEVAQILKSNKRTKDITIIFATALSKEHKYMMKGYEEGAVDYLYKPLDPEIVKAKVAVLLKLQLQKKELLEKNAALQKSALLISNSADIIGIIDAASLKIEEVNNAFTTLLGYSTQEVKNTSILFFLTNESRSLLQALSHEKKEQLSFETSIYSKERKIKWLQWKVVIKEGKWFVNARDITEIREVEKIRNYLATVVQQSNDAIYIHDHEGKIISWNDGAEKIYGYSESEALKMKVWNIIPEYLKPKTGELIHSISGGKKIQDLETKRITKHGKLIDVIFSAAELKEIESNQFSIAITERNITEQKIADEQIRQMNKDLEKRVAEKTKEVIEKERQYRFLLENMQEGIQVIDFEWRYLFVNESVMQQSRYSNEELVGHTMMEKYPGIENTQLFDVLQRCMKNRTDEIVENEFHYPDGTSACFELSIQPVPEGLFILSMDITERKKAEAEIIRSNKRFNMATKATADAIWDWNMVTNELYWGDSYETLFGYKVESNKGDLSQWINHIHPDDKERVISGVHKCIENKEIHWEDEYRYQKANGSFAYILDRGVVVYDAQQRAYQMIGAMHDITQIKEAEFQLRRLNETLEKRAAELQASNIELERFAFVASHDLQEPLRMVSSFLSLLKAESSDLTGDMQKYIGYALEGTDRMKKLIQALLTYSRLDVVKEPMTEVDCNKIMDNLQNIFEPTLQELKATLHVNPLPTVKAIEPHLQQLFQNLVGNALKYHNHNKPFVEVGCEEEAHTWKFYVKDNGIGIDNKYHEKIFIIFQRLHNKTEYSGTGIGLSICKKIVEKHGGYIWVESETGEGSTFYFTLPKHPHPSIAEI